MKLTLRVTNLETSMYYSVTVQVSSIQSADDLIKSLNSLDFQVALKGALDASDFLVGFEKLETP